jgi:DNA-binding MarR family transcriptional regulator
MRKGKIAPSAGQVEDDQKQALIPGIGEGKRGEAGHLGYLLRQAAGGFRLNLERALADFDVTSPQFVVMTMIAAYPGASNADLARLALLTPQTLSTIIANLLRAAIVSRHPHAVHGRIQQLQLTESGAKLLAKCRARVAHLEAQLQADLTSDEEQILRRWLVKVALIGKTED